MNNAFNNRLLLMLFVGACLLYGAATWIDSYKSKSKYKTVITSVDSSLISKLEIISKKADREPIILERTTDSWIGRQGSIESFVDHASINSVLDQIDQITVKRVASVSSDRWSDFEVSDSVANVVRAYIGEKRVIDLLVGNFNFQQQPQSVTTFVREPGDEVVYGIEGLLSMNIDRNFQSYRNRSFINLNAENITSVRLNLLEGQQILQKESLGWTLDGSAIDSVEVKNYLSALSTQRGNFFADGFEGDRPFSTISIRGNQMNEILVSAY
ncbi:MAG: DUF4340 domain-containing protein, partial [Bacteroidota bacterium]